MAQRGRKTEAYILMALAIVINVLIVYGFITRPVVAYHLSTPLEYNGTIDLSSEDLTVVLKARNLGGTPARIFYSVRLYNMTLTSPRALEVSPFNDFTLIRVPLEFPLKASGRDESVITINRKGDPDYLVLIFSLETYRHLNPVTGFFDSFKVQQPERPTALLLKRLEPGVYKRVTNR
ncbi:MAG: hypothetical protein QGF78_04250 [Candidatus Bathyarchaeota archaeon]|jgi:hypothetical protein|nr:hypothetical protein [Candidatus Bathyarchaeota archaeon]